MDIIAIDSGSPRSNDTVQVNVAIADINNQLPVFNDTSFQVLHVQEDSGLGTANQIGKSKLISYINLQRCQ